MLKRRDFFAAVSTPLVLAYGLNSSPTWADQTKPGIDVTPPRDGEDIFSFVHRQRGHFDSQLYRQVLGAANEFKEGDAIIGVAAADENARARARRLLANTRIVDLIAHPPLKTRFRSGMIASP